MDYVRKHFNVDAYTARLIGRESLAKVDSAIIELVKNGYDADAKVCIVYYDEIDKTIYICDNGVGMTEEIIDKHWMTIGNSSKRDECVTGNGRIQTGSKGIGRFALDRIASKCSMLTINRNNRVLWNVDWNEFSHEKLITDIYAEIIETEIDFNDFVVKSNNIDFKDLIRREFISTGTIFKLDNLNDDWDKKIVSKVRKSLDNIAIPGISELFKIYFFTNNQTIDNALIYPNRIDESDYEIKFEVKNENIKIYINRNEFDFKEKFDDVMLKGAFTEEDRKLFKGELKSIISPLDEFVGGYEEAVYKNIGDFDGEIYFNKIITPANDKKNYFYKDISGRRKYTKEFGGIKIYRDNFRVRPYGDYDSFNFDWLMLSHRKQLSPAAISDTYGSWKVNSDQITGIVNISRKNKALEDQSNRDGLVDNKEYDLFRLIIIKVISLFEEDRQSVVRKLREYNKTINSYEEVYNDILKKINNLEINNGSVRRENRVEDEEKNKEKGKINNEPKFNESHIETEKVKIVIEEKDNIIRDLVDENSLLASLATTGIMANTYIHEIRTINISLFSHIISIIDRLKLVKSMITDSQIGNHITKVIDSLSNIEKLKDKYNSWYEITINNIQNRRKEVGKVDIVKLFKLIKDNWEKVLVDKNISINVDCDEKEIIRTVSAQEIESILHNLITNSVSAFETIRFKGDKKHIQINITKLLDGFEILYHDNGPGLAKEFKKNPGEILKPFISGTMNSYGEKIGTGMGMWIIEKFVKQYRGEVDLSLNKTCSDGFYIKIAIKRRRRYGV